MTIRDNNASHRDECTQSPEMLPVLDSPLEEQGCRLRHFSRAAFSLPQRPLDENCVSLHLGRANLMRLRTDNLTLVTRVGAETITTVPAGASHIWSTEDPVDFAHIYIPRDRLARAAESIFDRDGDQIRLASRIGSRDELLSGLFHFLIKSVEKDCRTGHLRDVMLEAFLAQLLRRHSNLGEVARGAQYALAPKRLAEITAHIDARLGEDLTLDSLAAVARLSRYHFTRSFARATGHTPHAFVMTRRLARAKQLLRDTTLPIGEVAKLCGFANASHLSNRFAAAEGLRPTAFRTMC